MSTTPDVATQPLTTLWSQLEHSEFATELFARLRRGGNEMEEVAAFIREADDDDVLRVLGNTYRTASDTPWKSDWPAWLQLAALSTLRRWLFGSDAAWKSHRGIALSQTMQSMAQACLADAKDDEEFRETAHFVCNELCPWYAYPGMPGEEISRLMQELIQLQQKAKLEHYSMSWDSLLEMTTDPAQLVELAELSDAVCRDALWEHFQRIKKKAQFDPSLWQPWHDFVARHPAAYVRLLDNEGSSKEASDPALIFQALGGSNEIQRHNLVHALLYNGGQSTGKAFKSFVEILEKALPTYTDLIRKNLPSAGYQLSLTKLIWDKQYPELLPHLLGAIAENGTCTTANKTIAQKILAERPDDLLNVEPAKIPRLFPILDASAFKKILPTLGKVLAASSSKALREGVAKEGKRFSPADLVDAGWLTLRGKNIQAALRDILLAHPDAAAAAPLLAQMLASGAFDAGTASTVQAHLDQHGGANVAPAPNQKAGKTKPASGADSASTKTDALAALEAQAATIKRMAAGITHYASPETLALLSPLSEHAARVVLHLAATADGAPPPLLLQMLAQPTVENRSQLTVRLVNDWIASGGDPKLRWAMKLVSSNADDAAVDALTEAVFAWGKVKQQRAVAAVELLGEIDSLYALARAQEISGSRKLKTGVVDTARKTLVAAAKRRNLSIAELYDELTPDFGLSKGLSLSVGPRQYQIKLQGDLSLRVVDEKGKASKSLPANKDTALQAEWDAANNRFKTLTSSLKAIVKQQAPRMQAAWVTGKTWPAERWQRLFLQHPLLRIMGRSLIWQFDGGAKAAAVSFRIAEDFNLLDVQDAVVTLPPDAAISLWHPVSAKAAEAEAWRGNLADYEVEALVDQVGASADLPKASHISGSQLNAPTGLVITQDRLASIFSKLGYRPGPVEDGPSINWHEWLLPAAQLRVDLCHSFYSPYRDAGNAVTIEYIVVHDVQGYIEKSIAVNKLPKPLLATLMGHLALIASKSAVAS